MTTALLFPSGTFRRRPYAPLHPSATLLPGTFHPPAAILRPTVRRHVCASKPAGVALELHPTPAPPTWTHASHPTYTAVALLNPSKPRTPPPGPPLSPYLAVIAYMMAAFSPSLDVANAAVPTLLAIMLFLSGFLIRCADPRSTARAGFLQYSTTQSPLAVPVHLWGAQAAQSALPVCHLTPMCSNLAPTPCSHARTVACTQTSALEAGRSSITHHTPYSHTLHTPHSTLHTPHSTPHTCTSPYPHPQD